MEQQNNESENHAATVENENSNKGRCYRKRSPLKRFVIGILAVVGIVTVSSAITGCSMNKWRDADLSKKVEYISERLIKTVDASDQQAAEIKAIIEKFEPSLTSINANHQDHKATIIDIFQQEEVSATDLESERQAIIELLNQNSIELTKMVAEIANVLTLEQRMILIEKMNKHHHRY
jgi:hypothetical protein